MRYTMRARIEKMIERQFYTLSNGPAYINYTLIKYVQRVSKRIRDRDNSTNILYSNFSRM